MISHKYKCIFIHIPRVGGTSIEEWICETDWHFIDKKTKHILASQAKVIYKDFWDDYFKFSFVRNPWDRMVSCLKFKDVYGVKLQKNGLLPFSKSINVDGYRSKFGNEVVLEHDLKHYERSQLLSEKHLSGQVYGNILDEELDFIGRFENFAKDCEIIRQTLGIEKPMLVHTEKSERKHYRVYYNTRESIDAVRNTYRNDIEHFDYEF